MKHLIFGIGSIGGRHLNNLFRLGINKEDIFCFRRCEDHAFEKEFGVKILTKKEQIISLFPECVYICTPTSLHVRDLNIANELNAHVFMEKPLIHEKRLYDEIKNMNYTDKVFYIGYMLRFHPLFIKLQNIMKNKIIGSVYSARLEFGFYLPYWHPWEDYKISYAARKELGGGVFNTITHELDMAQLLFGEPLKVLSSQMNLKKLNIDVAEIGEVILEYPDKQVSIHVDFLQRKYNRTVTIYGDDGNVVWNWNDKMVIVNLYNGERKEIKCDDYDINDMYYQEIKKFHELIDQSVYKHALDFQYALKNTELLFNINKYHI